MNLAPAPSTGSARRMRRAYRRAHGGVFATLMLIAFAAATPARGATIALHETGTINGSVVTLGDIADIHEPDAARLQKFKAAVIGPAPAPGQKSRLDFQTVRGRLIALGFNAGELDFAGHSAIRLTAAQTPADAKVAPARAPTDGQRKRIENDLSAMIEAAIAKQRPDLARRDVGVELQPEQAVCLGNFRSSESHLGPLPAALDGAQSVTLQFRDANNQVKELLINFNAAAKPQIVVVRNGVPKGTVLRPEDVLIRTQDPATLRSPACSRIEDAIGREVTRTLRADEPVYNEDIRNVPLVRSGDVVTVYVRRGGITIKADGKARSAGAAGEIVQIQMLDARDKLQAKVIGFHEVQVEGTGAATGLPAGVRFEQAAQSAVPR